MRRAWLGLGALFGAAGLLGCSTLPIAPTEREEDEGQQTGVILEDGPKEPARAPAPPPIVETPPVPPPPPSGLVVLDTPSSPEDVDGFELLRRRAFAGVSEPEPTEGVRRDDTTGLVGRAAQRPPTERRFPAGAEIVFEGLLDDVSAQTVWVSDARGTLVALTVGPDATALIDGREVSIINLPEGRPVRVHFEQVLGRPMLRRLEILEPSERP